MDQAERVARSFVARNPSLRADLDDLAQEGRIARWQGRQMRLGMVDWLRATYGRTGHTRVTVARWDSLDAPAGEDDVTLGDLLPGTTDVEGEVVSAMEAQRLLAMVLHRCTPRQVAVLFACQRGDSAALARAWDRSEAAITHMRHRAQARMAA